MSESVNDKVYIHEFIDIIGHNRARYMHHMTANWSPIAQEERNQRCYGVWGVVGTTRRWPEVVNLWEEDGFDGLARSFTHEVGHATLQDPKLARWWAAAAELRRSGEDRVLVPAPWTRTIGQLCADGVRHDAWAHEQITVAPGTARDFLERVREEAAPALAPFGWELVGAWWTAMHHENEVFLLWGIPTWAHWGRAEKAWAAGDGAVGKWKSRTLDLATGFHRFGMAEAPLSPLRIGRQPRREDRADGWDENG